MAEWWEELLGMTPNMAGPTTKLADPYRNAEGRIDASAIKAAVPSAVAEDVDMATTIGNMRMQQLEGIKPKPETGWNTLGRALHAASIPVSFAQGNQAYGLWAANNDPSIAKRAREQQYEDATNKSKLLSIMDEALTGIGNSGLEYMKDRRKRKDAAVEAAAQMVAMAPPKDRPQALEDARAYLKSLGHGDMADALGQTSYATPETPNAAPAKPVDDGLPLSPDQVGVQRFAAPALAQGSMPQPPAAAVPDVYTSPPEVQAMYRQAQMVAATNPTAAKALLERAGIADRAAAESWKAQRESMVNARNGKYSVQPQWAQDENGNWSIIQLGPNAEAAAAKLPPGMKLVPPPEMAFQKRSFGEQGDAAGKNAAALPTVELASNHLVKSIDSLMNDPGLPSILGPIDSRTWDILPAATNARSKQEQVIGKVGLQAYNDLRGAGAITEQEGQRAAAAYARIQSGNLSPEDYKAALKELRDATLEMQQIARMKATRGLIKPNATSLEVAPGKYLYKQPDGHWTKDNPNDPYAANRQSAPTPGRTSIQSIQRLD